MIDEVRWHSTAAAGSTCLRMVGSALFFTRHIRIIPHQSQQLDGISHLMLGACAVWAIPCQIQGRAATL